METAKRAFPLSTFPNQFWNLDTQTSKVPPTAAPRRTPESHSNFVDGTRQARLSPTVGLGIHDDHTRTQVKDAYAVETSTCSWWFLSVQGAIYTGPSLAHRTYTIDRAGSIKPPRPRHSVRKHLRHPALQPQPFRFRIFHASELVHI